MPNSWRLERLLHQYAVEPAAELEADRLEGADHAEAGGLMQRDRRRLRRIADHRDHLPEGARLRLDQQPVEQRAPEAAPLYLRVDIDRILDGETIGRPRAIGSGIGVARDLAADLGREKRKAAVAQRS